MPEALRATAQNETAASPPAVEIAPVPAPLAVAPAEAGDAARAVGARPRGGEPVAVEVGENRF